MIVNVSQYQALSALRATRGAPLLDKELPYALNRSRRYASQIVASLIAGGVLRADRLDGFTSYYVIGEVEVKAPRVAAESPVSPRPERRDPFADVGPRAFEDDPMAVPSDGAFRLRRPESSRTQAGVSWY